MPTIFMDSKPKQDNMLPVIERIIMQATFIEFEFVVLTINFHISTSNLIFTNLWKK